jgi:hypothetical protein
VLGARVRTVETPLYFVRSDQVVRLASSHPGFNAIASNPTTAPARLDNGAQGRAGEPEMATRRQFVLVLVSVPEPTI